MVKETTYYEILGVEPTATEVELKKAYRKQAIKLHPDKNGNDPKAAEKFQELGEAYGILLNPDTRTLYDELGAEGMKQQNPEAAADIDPTEFMSMVFGGEGFKDWIGELSMISDLSKTAEIMEENEGEATPVDGKPATTSEVAVSDDANTLSKPSSTVELTSESINKKKKQKMTKEQREQIIKLQEELKAEKQKRVDDLAKILIDKIEKYTLAKTNTDALNNFQTKLHREFEDMKIESFGLQMLHLIGSIYTDQAQATSASLKTFGVSKLYTSVKSKTNTMKTGFSILKTALDAQAAVDEMVRQQEQLELTKQQGGEISDQEKYLQAERERHITGKFLATAWASTKFEITGVLNKVCDKVLNDKSLNKKQRLARAEAVLYLGKQMTAVQRSPEEDDEARIFEEMMADATAKKSKKNQRKAYSDAEFAQFLSEQTEAEKSLEKA